MGQGDIFLYNFFNALFLEYDYIMILMYNELNIVNQHILGKTNLLILNNFPQLI